MNLVRAACLATVAVLGAAILALFRREKAGRAA
jgi:hypothetical protein